MRILVVSNLYPPHYVGGYELGCRDVVEGLRARGHGVKVLTSTYGVDGPVTEGETYRWLKDDLDWEPLRFDKYLYRLLKRERINQQALHRLLNSVQPDIVYFWNLARISISLVYEVQRKHIPTCFFVSDPWLSKWEDDAWYTVWYSPLQHPVKRLLKSLFKPLLRTLRLIPPPYPFKIPKAHFVSQDLKHTISQAGKRVQDAEVFRWGIPLDSYPFSSSNNHPRRLLYVGQVAAHKGVHTAIEALHQVVKSQPDQSITLTIVGGTTFPEYQTKMHQLVQTLGLDNYVHFLGLLPREALTTIYQEHDILLFPSVWEEPFSITLLEAMASGLAVVGTTTGGSAEILKDEVNALVFPKEDAVMCARQIERLLADEELFESIRRSGRETVENNYSIDSMIANLEQSLLKIAKSGRARSRVDAGCGEVS